MLPVKSSLLLIGQLFIVLSGCALVFPEDPNLLNVEPVKFVPCSSLVATCGRVPVAPDQAEGFVVTVSYERFRSIVHDCLSRETCSEEEVVKLLGAFAAKQVISRDFCKSAEVPSDRRHVLAWEGRGERGVYVKCVN